MHSAFVWLTLFVWTLALELPVYAALLRDRLRGPRQACLLVLGVNVITHPALFLAEPLSRDAALAAELMVALAEGLLMAACLGRPALRPALVASLSANLLSMIAGLALTAWLFR
jgi:hypothetical protein